MAIYLGFSVAVDASKMKNGRISHVVLPENVDLEPTR
jgi:hypothetical protein